MKFMGVILPWEGGRLFKGALIRGGTLIKKLLLQKGRLFKKHFYIDRLELKHVTGIQKMGRGYRRRVP